MGQINIRVDASTDEVITFLADQRHVSRSEMARELIDAGKNQLLLPALAKLYRDGKISLKKVVQLTGMHHVEVIERLATLIDDAPITPELDDYTAKITELILKRLLNSSKISAHE